MKIMLQKRPRPNKLIWGFDKHGNYTVKSGYQVALKLKFPDRPSTSKRKSTEWQTIWKLEVLEKVKIFIWRVAQNLLPTIENL